MTDASDENPVESVDTARTPRPGFAPATDTSGTAPTLGLSRTTGHPGRRRAYAWIAAAVAASAAAAGVVVAVVSPGSHRQPRSTPSGAAPVRRPHLPLSAGHDAHGLIVTLPDLKGILGPTPVPDVTMSDNRVMEMTINGSKVTNEVNGGLTDTASRFRLFQVTLNRWPTPSSMGHDWGRTRSGPYRENSHKWTGAATRLAGLGDDALIYEFSTGPSSADISGRSVKYDTRGANLEARYRNVQIDISLRSADFQARGGKVDVAYAAYREVQRELETVARKIINHLRGE